MDIDKAIASAKFAHLFDNSNRYLYHSEPGYRVWFVNLGNGEMLVTEEYDGLEELFKQNAAEAAEFSRTSQLGDTVKQASVPSWLVNQWEKELGTSVTKDKEFLKRKLNDPDNAKFRVNNLKV